MGKLGPASRRPIIKFATSRGSEMSGPRGVARNQYEILWKFRGAESWNEPGQETAEPKGREKSRVSDEIEVIADS